MLKLLALCVIVSCVTPEPVVIETGVGTIVGQKNDGFNTFFGVPYETVDENNPFGNTLSHPKFKNPFIANDSSITCPQDTFQINSKLQCLRLNIYVPHTANRTNQLPILVWFHGNLKSGNAGQYGGQHLVKKDIIVITANYRLGPYGFLCLNDRGAPGNQGMRDQFHALFWIHFNIEAFGGNSSSVTVAGGSAVDLHLYSNFYRFDMFPFDKVIIQSGSIFSEGFYVNPDWGAAIKMAKHLGHNVTENKDALKLLAKENPHAVMVAAKNLSLPIGICREPNLFGVFHYMKKGPFKINSYINRSKTKIMIGYTSMEKIGLYANPAKGFFDNLGDVFLKTVKNNFNTEENVLKNLSVSIKKFYLGENLINSEAVLELSKFSSDIAVNHPVERSVNEFVLANDEAKVFKYLFSYIGGSRYKNISGAGAPHGEELKYLFETDEVIYGEEQLMMRDRMTTLWANFVKFGDPTPVKTDSLPVAWTPVRGKSRPYLNIDVNISMSDHVFHDRMTFWDQLWNNFEGCALLYDQLYHVPHPGLEHEPVRCHA